jgi:Protein of unknown function (DUF3828)
MTRHIFILFVFVFCSSGVFAKQPDDVVREFYQWQIHGKSGGRTEAALRPVKGLLTAKLHRALIALDTYEAACGRIAAPNTKPYIFEGDPYYHYAADGAKELISVKGDIFRSTAMVGAKLGHTGSVWTDTVVLVIENGDWRIVDIRFEQGGSLTKSLVDFVSHKCYLTTQSR